jgi:hypothetical protein
MFVSSRLRGEAAQGHSRTLPQSGIQTHDVCVVYLDTHALSDAYAAVFVPGTGVLRAADVDSSEELSAKLGIPARAR